MASSVKQMHSPVGIIRPAFHRQIRPDAESVAGERIKEISVSNEYQRELEVALQAVSLAGQVCRSVQAKIAPNAMEKADRSPVTIADYASQALVSKVLEEHFPHDPIIGEEDSQELREPEQQMFRNAIQAELGALNVQTSEEQLYAWIDRCSTQEYSERFWTLDPIDGTKGFLRKEQYAISLALIVNGEIVVAAVGCPNLGESVQQSDSPRFGLMYSAVRGAGAEVRSIWLSDEPRPVRVSAEADVSQMRFCESVESGHSSHGHSAQVAERLQISAEPVRLDSQAKYCVVARGEADIYLRLPTRAGYREKIWDHAGGVLVVQEAGGQVSDVTGRPLDFTRGAALTENRGVVVTNGKVHDQVIQTLREVGVE